MKQAIADPWAESRQLQADQAANSKEFAAAVDLVRNHAMDLVKGEDHRVRVEDYLAVLAAATGEATLVDSGCMDIEHTDLIPGKPVFGDAINRILSDDRASLADAGSTTVVGILRDHLIPAVATADAFGSIERLYRYVAENVGSTEWGTVRVSVPEAHWPATLPIKSAFDMRSIVNGEAERLGFRAASSTGDLLGGGSRHALCATALASAIIQTAAALDPQIAITLALEVTFAMAKTVPVSRIAFDRSGQVAP